MVPSPGVRHDLLPADFVRWDEIGRLPIAGEPLDYDVAYRTPFGDITVTSLGWEHGIVYGGDYVTVNGSALGSGSKTSGMIAPLLNRTLDTQSRDPILQGTSFAIIPVFYT